MLAGELALAGIDVVIVERRANQDVDGSRAGGLHSRTIEVLDQRGIAERFLSAGEKKPARGFARSPRGNNDVPTPPHKPPAPRRGQSETHPPDLAGGVA